MNDIEKRVISDNFKFLVDNILADKLYPDLIQFGIITFDDISIILSKPSKLGQAFELLQYINRSPVPKTFQIFLDCLNDNGWEFLAVELQSAFRKLNPSWKDTGSATAVNEILQPVSYFCHRKSLEEKIHDCLQIHNYAVLAGIRGAGKTQLARYFTCQTPETKTPCPVGNHGVKMEIYSRSIENFHSDIEYLMQVLNIPGFQSNSMEKAISSGLKTILEHLKNQPTCCSTCHYLIFDDITNDTYRFLTKQMLNTLIKQCDNIKVLITTNNINLYGSDAIITCGLEQQESLDLFKHDYISSSNDKDILELSERLSYLPLGIAAAKQIIRKRHQTVQDYLKQLLAPSTSKKLQSKEAQVFMENEYDKGLMSALTISIGEISSMLDPKVFELYELTALGSHVRFPLSVLTMLMKWTDDDAEKDFELGNLVEVITDTAVGTVIREGDEIYLDTHQAVSLAIRLNWPSKKLQEYIGTFLILMSNICVKDTRFQDAFRVQMTLLPHAEAVMKHALNFDQTTLGLQVAEIRLLEAIGYMYTQVSMLDKSQHYLIQARDFFVKYFLDNDTTLFEASNSLDLKNKAELIIQKLNERCMKENTEEFMQFILKRAHLERDRILWRTMLQQTLSLSSSDDLFTSPILSKEDFLQLQQNKMALGESDIQKLFLPELLITTLYTLGRIYFFRSSKGEYVSKADRAVLKSSLHLAHDLCVLIHEKYDVPLLHLILTRHYGLIYLMMEKKDESKEEHVKILMEAKANYENVIGDTRHFFQCGLLKKVANDDYNTAVCLRQIIRCYARLLRYDSPENFLSHKEEGLKHVHHLQKILECNQSLFHVSGFNLNIAKFYAQIALEFKTWEDFEIAMDLYSRCCDAECKSGYVKYPWLLALKGLGYLLLHFGIRDRDHYSITRTLKKVEDFLSALHGRSASFPFEWRKGCALLSKMQIFQDCLSSETSQSSVDFLRSERNSIDDLDDDEDVSFFIQPGNLCY